jgi:hypothetical protein
LRAQHIERCGRIFALKTAHDDIEQRVVAEISESVIA